MKIIIQRCSNALVKVDDKVTGKINHGLVLLVGFTSKKDEQVIDYMIDKILNLRIFDDEKGIMNKSLIDTCGSILSISQFTLYANASKGRRPSYIKALNGTDAKILYDLFNQKLKDNKVKVATGIFGADMKVSLTNDGPVTIILEKE